MRAITLDPLPPTSLEDPPKQTRRSTQSTPRQPVPDIDWSKDLPTIWAEPVKTIAKAVREVQTKWHSLFLAIAGALLSRGIPPEHIPALCRAISLETGQDTRTGDREACARTTVTRYLNKQPVTGLGTLKKQWPNVGLAVEQTTVTGSVSRLYAQANAKPRHPIRPLKETLEAMEEAVRSAPSGVSLFGAECGLGKTAIALKTAASRAATPHVSKNAAGLRAPEQTKTAISVDKNKLAIQVQLDLQRREVPVKRIFGPLSVLNENKEPVCIYYKTARHLVSGGQSLQREICEGRGIYRCRNYDSCIARPGFSGTPNARIITGPHQLVNVLDREAGNTGLLVIDEPPDLLTTTTISNDELACTLKTLSAFSSDFIAAMKPSLLATEIWLADPKAVPKFTTVKDAIRLLSPLVDPRCLQIAQEVAHTAGDAADCAVEAPVLDPRSKAPPILLTALAGAKSNEQRARDIGVASKVLGCLYHAIGAPWPVMGDVDTFPPSPVLMVTSAHRTIMEALRRDGPVVIMDANVEANAPIYELALGYKPPIHLFAAEDGAPIARTLLRCSAASRKHWFDQGKLIAVPSFIQAFKEMFRWLNEKSDDKRLGLITFLPIKMALDVILNSEDKNAQETWDDFDQCPETLEKLQKELSPLFSQWNGQVVLGYYGNIRGLNDMADVDCLVTFGDP